MPAVYRRDRPTGFQDPYPPGGRKPGDRLWPECVYPAAKGAYLARMDGDDISLPHRLEVQKAFLDVNPEIDYVGSAAALLEGEKLWGMRRLRPFLKKKISFPFLPISTLR